MPEVRVEVLLVANGSASIIVDVGDHLPCKTEKGMLKPDPESTEAGETRLRKLLAETAGGEALAGSLPGRRHCRA